MSPSPTDPMDGGNMSAETVDASDIQGLVRFGYAALTEAAFLLLKIRDAGAARSWISSAPITTAEKLSRPPMTALQVGFTREGLEALGVRRGLAFGILR